MTRIHEFGESYEMYLKAACELAEPDQPVPVTALADRLGVATVSASEMVHRLQAQGLIQHEPYKGVRLTKNGSQVASRVLRSHRLWERFLVDSLGLDWAACHDYACELEHLADPEVVDALDKLLGRPATCPHGNPISPQDQRGQRKGTGTLSSLAAGDRGTVLAIAPESLSVLQAVQERALLPGTPVEVVEIEVFDGPRSLLVNGHQQTVGRRLADHVIVELGVAAGG